MTGRDLDSTLDDQPVVATAAGRPSGGRDRYELREEIARGGTGRVSRAHDRRLEREVAIKSLLDPTASHALRFAREARVTARLQHPSIVPIYDIGRLDDGQPYYAMKLVSGRTLDEAIREAGSLAHRLELLPALLGVADAIAYAHAQRVIHRDLKPHNVVLGPFGESLVIDWGLAKHLDAGDTEELAGDELLADPGLTVEGSVLGTPAYMPPEQASGRSVDERADVYALGAMLYHLLAGRAPYRGRDGRAVVLAVLESPPSPVASLVDGVPEELQAIVAKAMARRPEDRYADAKQLAGDLRRFATGQLVAAHRYTLWSHLRRFVRRHAAAVIVAAVLGATLAAGSVVAVVQILDRTEVAEEQRKAAEAARALALTQRDAAEELAGFMLDDLRAQVEPIGRLDLLRGVGERVRGYYATLDAAGVPLDVAADRRRGRALALVGDAELDAGDLAAALATFEQVRDAAARLDDRSLAARADERIGAIHRRRGELEVGIERLETAVALAEDAGELELAVRARTLLSAAVSERGDWAEAHAEAEAAIASARAVTDIDAAANRLDLSDALMMLATTAWKLGDQDGRELLHEAREVMLDALDDDPYDARMLAQLLRIDERMARLEPGAADARMFAAEASDLAKRLRVIEPANVSFVRAQLSALETDATVRGIAGDGEGALAGYRDALATAQLGARLEPENLDAHRTVAYMHNRVGDAQYSVGDYAGAADTYRIALAAAREVGAREGGRFGRMEVVHAGYDLGGVLAELGRRDEAVAAYREAIAVGEPLLREGDDPDVSRFLALALIGAAGLEPDREVAHRHAARAVELLEGLPSPTLATEQALEQARDLVR